MTESSMVRLGSLPEPATPEPTLREKVRNLPWAFLLVVVLPTVLVAFYYFVLATPRYVSEAHFIVRETNSRQPTGLGLVLQSAGLSAAQGDAFAVHEYMTSRDALRELDRNGMVSRALSAPGVDFLSRQPNAWSGHTFEDLYKGFQRYLTVGYNSQTGISTVRVEAFTPQEAQKINDALLQGGEQLVNRLNERAGNDSVAQASRSVEEARTRLAASQANLSGFRNREQFIDPELSARESSALLGSLNTTLAGLRAERAQIASEAPASPQLPIIDSRIRAYEQQIATERGKITGDPNSLAPKIGAYEALVLERELAAQALSTANVSLDNARQEARRQTLYLERVVSPSLPDKATQPTRWRALLTVLLTCLVTYALGWLLVAGVREHKQD